MTDPVTPEEYGLRAAKRQLKKDNASLVEQNLALRSKVSVLAAQLEAAQERERQRCIAVVRGIADAQVDPVGYATCQEILDALDSAQTHGGPDE